MRPSPQSFDGLGDAEEIRQLQERLDDLIALGGEEKIASMVHRFADQLEAILDGADHWPTPVVHRFVGLAGILGFSRVERTWRSVEVDGARPELMLAARSAAAAALTFSKQWRVRIGAGTVGLD